MVDARQRADRPRRAKCASLAGVITLVTLGDSDVRMAALVDVTVVQGEPRTIEVRLPRRLRADGRDRQLARVEQLAGRYRRHC